MFVATADQLAETVRQDFWWLRAARWILHSDRQNDHRFRFWVWLLLPIGFVFSMFYAQLLPFLFDRALPPILRQLPWTTNREILARVEDLLRVCHELLRVVGKYSLARKKTALWLDELDEQIDSLEFVRLNGTDVDAEIAQIRGRHGQHSQHAAG
jgi:hypothetical protein